MHHPDNSDGTFSNPVMPNAHWSDPCVIRVVDEFYCATSSIETCPIIQIVHSRDLVNWDVLGSVSRLWPDDLPAIMNWSPRISFVNGRFRVTAHHTVRGFAIWESDSARGPWLRIEHDLGDLSGCNFAVSFFTDEDGSKYLLAGGFVQAVDVTALRAAGERVYLGPAVIPENASMIRRGDWVYYFTSENGTVTWGVGEDGGKISAWRARHPLGPWEKSPHAVIVSSVRWQCVNTGSVVLGPDRNIWYLYNAIDPLRMTMCRQMMLDRIDWTNDGWPSVNDGRGPRSRCVKPGAGAPSWAPELTDEFDTSELEGITGGVLGRKWLFKQEDPSAWSLTDRPGFLRLRTRFPSIDHLCVANMVMQRPVGAYYRIETSMDFSPRWSHQNAGLIVRELHTRATVAIGLQMDHVMQLKLWHDEGTGLRELATLPAYQADFSAKRRVQLAIEARGIVFRCFYRFEPEAAWQSAGADFVFSWKPMLYFSAFHPGLFAGEAAPTNHPGHADFDYFRHFDMENPLPSATLPTT